jgi:hypothetical protein
LEYGKTHGDDEMLVIEIIAIILLLCWCIFGAIAGWGFFEEDDWPIPKDEPDWQIRSAIMAMLYGPLFCIGVLLYFIIWYGCLKWAIDLHNKMMGE